LKEFECLRRIERKPTTDQSTEQLFEVLLCPFRWEIKGNLNGLLWSRRFWLGVSTATGTATRTSGGRTGGTGGAARAATTAEHFVKATLAIFLFIKFLLFLFELICKSGSEGL
jgi:hypothetical protein